MNRINDLNAVAWKIASVHLTPRGTCPAFLSLRQRPRCLARCPVAQVVDAPRKAEWGRPNFARKGHARLVSPGLIVVRPLNTLALMCSRMIAMNLLKNRMQDVGNPARLPNPNSWEPSSRMLPNRQASTPSFATWLEEAVLKSENDRGMAIG